MWNILVSFCRSFITDSEFIMIFYIFKIKKVTKLNLVKPYLVKIAKTKNTITLVRKLKIEKLDHCLSYFNIKKTKFGLHLPFVL